MERWLSGLRHRTRYTGNRVGGSNPSPLRHTCMPLLAARLACRLVPIGLALRRHWLRRDTTAAIRQSPVRSARSTQPRGGCLTLRHRGVITPLDSPGPPFNISHAVRIFRCLSWSQPRQDKAGKRQQGALGKGHEILDSCWTGCDTKETRLSSRKYAGPITVERTGAPIPGLPPGTVCPRDCSLLIDRSAG